AFQGQPAISRSSPGTQQRTASRDTQPWTVCRVPQQQLPGHSAADRLQTRRHGQCAGSLSGSSQGTQQQTASRDMQPWTTCRVPISSSSQGTQQRRLMQSCGDSQPWGIAEGYSPDLLGIYRVRSGDGWGGSVPLIRASQRLSGSKMIPAA
ncbi:unnamed protein product, partial [Staurois parvus]